MLRDAGAAMEQKPFAIGVRIEHRQDRISRAQLGEQWAAFPLWTISWCAICHGPVGLYVLRLPWGQIVAAASQPGGLVTNGMSNRARDGAFINGGFLVGVGPGDFGSEDPLAGAAFQALWEGESLRLWPPWV